MSEFKLLEKIGEGGMGVVFHALQLPLRREVAVKFLRAAAADDEAAKKRFEREMETLSRLSHPNIMRIFDAGVVDGKLFIAMEYLKGALSLEQVILKEGPMPVERAVKLMIPLLEALDHVHATGLLHRDIKPANILMVEEEQRPILMDFGLVKVSDKTALTKTGFLVGSPKYMSPEKLMGQDEDASSDLWSMGLVLYQLLTGQAAFTSPSLPDLCKKIMDEPHPPVRQSQPAIPAQVDAVLDRFLEKDPARRIRSAREAAELLQSLLEDEALPFLPQAAPVPPFPAARAVAATLACVTLITLGGLAWRRSDQRPPPRPVPSYAPGPVAEPTWSLDPDRVLVDLEASAPGRYHLAARQEDREVVAIDHDAPGPGKARLVLEGLKPGQRYSLLLTGPEHHALHEREVTMPTLESVAREVASSIERFDPYKQLVGFTKEHYELWNLEQTGKRLPKGWTSFLASWDRRLADSCEKTRLTARVEAFGRVKDAIYAASEVPGDLKRGLYHRFLDLRELEEGGQVAGLHLPALAAQLSSPVYGRVGQSGLQKPQGPIFQLEHEPVILVDFPGWKKYIAQGTLVDRGFRDKFKTIRDQREGDDFVVEEILGNLFISPQPIRLPAGEKVKRLELQAFIRDGLPASGLDVWISSRRDSEREEWKRIAQLATTERGNQLVVHTLPVDVLGTEPFYLVAELAYCRNWHMMGGNQRQKIHVMFLSLLYDVR